MQAFVFQILPLDIVEKMDYKHVKSILLFRLPGCSKAWWMRTGTSDTVINQLMCKMDGVEQLNNILVTGTTSQIDLLDKLY